MVYYRDKEMLIRDLQQSDAATITDEESADIGSFTEDRHELSEPGMGIWSIEPLPYF